MQLGRAGRGRGLTTTKVGRLIGPRGATIQGIQNETGVRIKVADNDGTQSYVKVFLMAPDTASLEQAKAYVAEVVDG